MDHLQIPTTHHPRPKRPQTIIHISLDNHTLTINIVNRGQKPPEQPLQRQTTHDIRDPNLNIQEIVNKIAKTLELGQQRHQLPCTPSSN